MITSPEAALRHIVDINGQLFGIEPATVNATVLKALSGAPGDLVQILGDAVVPLQPLQSVMLREDEILFFRSTPLAKAQTWQQRWAA